MTDRCARAMAATLVFIFVVEYLPGNVLNKSIESATQLFEMENLATTAEKCDQRIADPILQTISREKDLVVVPKWMFNEEVESSQGVDNTLLKGISKETQQNIEKDLESSFDSVRSSSLELTKFIDDNSIAQDIFQENSECEHDSTEHHLNVTKKLSVKVSFPTLAPFLAAIFESLEEVTAQTCGGTVVAPEWVLTAASCIGMLHNLYTNQTSVNVTAQSEYTVIANSSNPFSEGTAHNVTEIHLHPDQKVVPEGRNVTRPFPAFGDTKWRMITPTLAMLRVDPPIDVELVDMVTTPVPPKSDVMVYGWMFNKNDSDHAYMSQSFFAAKTLSPRECKEVQNASTTVLCLIHENSRHLGIDSNELWMSSGGPVLSMEQGMVKLLGIASTEQNLPTSTYPLANHAHWINSLISTH